jgi:predicted PurR-regulated permease PerM
MSAVVLVLLVVGVATAGIMTVLVIALVRHMKVLAEAARDFQSALEPSLEEIRRAGERAQEQLQTLEERRSGRGAGVRLRT